jgi:hypothetical protein
MILNPSIIALLTGSLLTCGMLLYASVFAVQILLRWDLSSGSELQLELERKTYLISTIMTYALGFQLISLFLFIYTADSLCSLFVGAMCAVGSLKANGWGYPAIILQTIAFLFAGVWLIVNGADNRGYDYPLVRKKYLLLLFTAPLVLAQTVVQTVYFLMLKANIITSCCGSLFGANKVADLSGDLAALPRVPLQIAFGTILAVTLAAGVLYCLKGRLGWLYALGSFLLFPVAVASLISFISPYIYELPTHHCPFCILQREYRYIGYLLYAALLAGGVAGSGVGVLLPFRQVDSLKEVLPGYLRRLSLFGLLCYGIFAAATVAEIAFSHLRMGS